MIKRILNKLPRNQRGVVLIIVLILLAVGGLIIAPMLSHMSTGLKAGQTYEKKTEEYYAADAGVEDALWQITREQRIPEFPSEEGDQWPYSIGDINGKTVDITITYVDEDDDGNDVYKINSVASADGSDTAIESYVTFGGGFAFLLDNAITSPGGVDLQPGVDVEGTIMCGNHEDYEGDPNYEVVPYEGSWPTKDLLSEVYIDDVDTGSPTTGDINLNGNDMHIGPRYHQGDLKIVNSKNNTNPTITIDDTVYITGRLEIKNTKPFTLDLNCQTIFVESNATNPNGAIDISDNDCIITGSGCIITVGDVYFKPNMSSDEDDFVLIMSINGEVNFQPNGDYYGSVAGELVVNSQPGGYIEWKDWRELGECELNFPNVDEDDTTGKSLAVRTWEIS